MKKKNTHTQNDRNVFSLSLSHTHTHTHTHKMTEMYSLTVLEANSLKSKHWQGCAPPEVLREDPSCLCQLLVVPGVPGLAAGSISVSASAVTWHCPCASVFPLLARTPVMLDEGPS